MLLIRRRKVEEEENELLPDPRGKSPSKARQVNTIFRQISTIWRQVCDSLVPWWYEDMPPLHGPLRITFYLGMLFILYMGFDGSGHSCLRASNCRKYVSFFRHYEGLGFQLKREAGLYGLFLSAFGMDAPEKYFNCELLSNAVWWGLGLSGIGLGGRLPRIITAIAWWTMFGAKLATFNKQVGHELYLPGVAFIVFCFAEGNLIDSWSVDSQVFNLLRRIMPRSKLTAILPSTPQSWDGGPSPGRAARKLVLIQATCVMFFAGVHKFASYGFTWLGGGTIFYSIDHQEGRAPALQEFMLKHAWFFSPNMGTVSVVGELCAIAAVFSRRWRPYVVASWVGFHIGIMLLMHPNFAMNMCTYTLLIDWRAIICAVLSRLSAPRFSLALPQTTVGSAPALGSMSKQKPHELDTANGPKRLNNLRLGVTACTVWALAMFTTSLLRVDYFPFSSWALYNWHPTDPGLEKRYTVSEATETARKCVRQPPLNPSCDNLGGTNHHGMFLRHGDYMEVILVTALDESASRKQKAKKSNNHCHSNELRIYKNWEPHSCWPLTKDAASISDDVRNLLRYPTTESKGKRRPKELPHDFWGSSTLIDGLEWRMRDAVAASIDEGAKCFEPIQSDAIKSKRKKGKVSKVNWMAKPSEMSPASQLARRLRSRLPGSEYMRDGETALGLGIFFEFDETNKKEREKRHCKMGESFVGDEYLLARQSERGQIHLMAQPGERHLKRKGDWTDVNRGIVLVSLILFVTFKRSPPSKGM